MQVLKLMAITMAILALAPVGTHFEAEAQGCTESFCYSIRKSTGACNVPDLEGCNCACDYPT